jgi:hypothetical protein
MRLGTAFEHRARIAHALIDLPGTVILGRPVPVAPEEGGAESAPKAQSKAAATA